MIILEFCILSLYKITNMSEEEKAKHDVLEAVFYDDEYGYGSKINTLNHAKQTNKDITMDDRNLWIKFHLETRRGIVIAIHLSLIFPRMNLWWT